MNLNEDSAKLLDEFAKALADSEEDQVVYKCAILTAVIQAHTKLTSSPVLDALELLPTLLDLGNNIIKLKNFMGKDERHSKNEGI